MALHTVGRLLNSVQYNLAAQVHAQQPSDEPIMTPCEMESLLRQLTNPDSENEMHAAALRQQLRDLLETSEQFDYQTPPQVDLVDKRSYASIMRNSGGGGGPGETAKRNIGLWQRLGAVRMPPAGNDVDTVDGEAGAYEEHKRSLATLAKNGQMPAVGSTSQEPDREASDDGVGESAALAQQFKRNMAAMARSGLIGTGGRVAESNNKRNVGALARDWTLPTSQSNGRLNGTRRTVVANIKKSLFDVLYRLVFSFHLLPTVQKRNIGSMKNSPVHGDAGAKGTKVKRSLYSYDEYPSVSYMQQEEQSHQLPAVVYRQQQAAESAYRPAEEPQMDYNALAKYISQMYYAPSQFADDFDSDLHLKKRFLGE